ncbi:3-demethylubiquinone-9 3-methyltransferase [Clostridium acetobutylicum]|nr:3-demethylubiquinone-9 3-methyltransferase [Clostridium acetobutylicum]
MEKIIPHLWYDKEAKEAAEFYISLFENSKLLNTAVLDNTPSGNAETVNFILAGLPFAAISAGPFFKFNPSISLSVACSSRPEVKRLWNAFSEGGTVLMPLDNYPFSALYGWVQDRYGLSWQLILHDFAPITQKITPSLLFSGSVTGKAEEAMEFYTSIFENSEITFINRYAEGEAKAKNAKINFASFKLNNTNFSAGDNGFDTNYSFNESFSLIINCKNQSEIDYYSEKLSHVPEAEQCGWVKDKYGISWQIIPRSMNEILSSGTKEEIKRVTDAFLKMKKFDIDALEKAKRGY